MRKHVISVWMALAVSLGTVSASFAQEGHEGMKMESVCVVHECSMVKKGEKCPMIVAAFEGEKVTCPVCKENITTHASQEKILPPSGYTTVYLSPQKQQFIGVKIGLVERKKAVKTIRAAGRIAYDPDLYQAQSEYIQAIRSLRETPAGSDGKEAEWAKKLAESAKTRLASMGLNEELIASLGNQEGPDKSLLYSVPDADTWVYASVYEYEIPFVKIGQKLKIEIPSEGGRVLEGSVRAIDKNVNSETRTVRVRANVKNDGSLKPDLYVNILIDVDLGETILVPEDAVFITGKSNIVFVDKGEGVYEPRHVTLGTKVDDDYEIKEGLKEGERVVTNGNFMIDAESRLKAALGAMGHKHGG